MSNKTDEDNASSDMQRPLPSSRPHYDKTMFNSTMGISPMPNKNITNALLDKSDGKLQFNIIEDNFKSVRGGGGSHFMREEKNVSNEYAGPEAALSQYKTEPQKKLNAFIAKFG